MKEIIIILCLFCLSACHAKNPNIIEARLEIISQKVLTSNTVEVTVKNAASTEIPSAFFKILLYKNGEITDTIEAHTKENFEPNSTKTVTLKYGLKVKKTEIDFNKYEKIWVTWRMIPVFISDENE
ncbi:MAG: hypothetical protein ACSHX8_13955 [Opitutaceae bacterium]